MSKKLLFVANPISGKGAVKNKLLDIINIFIKNGWNVNIHLTQGKDDACNVIRKTGNKFDLVVVLGGDGTLNEGIRGIMDIPQEKRPRIGYIPMGTTNDFAANLKIPKNPLLAAKNIVNGNDFQYDIGCFNDKKFAYVAAFGAFTDVAYNTPQQNKNLLGQTAYFLEGIKKIHSLKSYKMKVSSGDTEFEDEFIFGMVSNTNYLGGIKAEKVFKAQLNDGMFEVILIRRPKTLLEVQDLIAHLLIQEFNTDAFKVFCSNNVRFESEKDIPWTLDGEFGGEERRVEISLKEKAVTMLLK